MLSAGAAGAVGVHADIVGVHLNIYVLLNIGHNVAGHKGGLAFARGIKGRYTHQTVHPMLRAQISVCILTVNLHGDRFDSRFLTVQEIQHMGLKALALSPAAVHAVKYAAPVTGLGSARPCVQAQDGIIGIIFPREQKLHPHILQGFLKLFQHLLNLRNQGGIIFLVSHLNHYLDILILLLQCPVGVHLILQVLGLPYHPGGLFRLVPETRLLHGLI